MEMFNKPLNSHIPKSHLVQSTYRAATTWTCFLGFQLSSLISFIIDVATGKRWWNMVKQIESAEFIVYEFWLNIQIWRVGGSNLIKLWWAASLNSSPRIWSNWWLTSCCSIGLGFLNYHDAEQEAEQEADNAVDHDACKVPKQRCRSIWYHSKCANMQLSHGRNHLLFQSSDWIAAVLAVVAHSLMIERASHSCTIWVLCLRQRTLHESILLAAISHYILFVCICSLHLLFWLERFPKLLAGFVLSGLCCFRGRDGWNQIRFVSYSTLHSCQRQEKLQWMLYCRTSNYPVVHIGWPHWRKALMESSRHRVALFSYLSCHPWSQSCRGNPKNGSTKE